LLLYTKTKQAYGKIYQLCSENLIRKIRVKFDTFRTVVSSFSPSLNRAGHHRTKKGFLYVKKISSG
ncbi:MAG: hypothetical protein ACYTX0_57630, partial [Nostoc sp.]